MDSLAGLWGNSSLEFVIGGQSMKETRGIRCLPKGAAYDEMSSPVGTLTIITSSEGLHAILWDIDRKSAL